MTTYSDAHHLARALRQQAGNERLARYKRHDLKAAAGILERYADLEALLGSLVVHAQELDLRGSTIALGTDVAALKAAANDERVTAWLDTIDPALLPIKR